MQPTFGDHLMITFNLPLAKPKIEATFKRDWRKYNSINLNIPFLKLYSMKNKVEKDNYIVINVTRLVGHINGHKFLFDL